MALIICTECGKKFSDKAACCPECGCPTEVESVRAKAKQAEDLFDSRNRTIQRKAPLCRMTTATGGGTVEKRK
ncbi:MAG: hypothetical protein IKM13_07600 [Clostridia bacterium]|nr:hypothetical protein [Clostridia bacterium]